MKLRIVSLVLCFIYVAFEAAEVDASRSLSFSKMMSKATRLKIRADPNLESPKVGTLDKDEIVTVLAQTQRQVEIDGKKDVWYLIFNSSGITGWTFGGYLENAPSTPTKMEKFLDTIGRTDMSIIYSFAYRYCLIANSTTLLLDVPDLLLGKSISALKKNQEGRFTGRTLSPSRDYFVKDYSLIDKNIWYEITIENRTGWVQGKDLALLANRLPMDEVFVPNRMSYEEIFPSTGVSIESIQIFNDIHQLDPSDTIPPGSVFRVMERVGFGAADMYRVVFEKKEGYIASKSFVLLNGKKYLELSPNLFVLQNYSGAFYSEPGANYCRDFSFWLVQDQVRPVVKKLAGFFFCLHTTVSPNQKVLYWNGLFIRTDNLQTMGQIEDKYAAFTWIDDEHLVLRGVREPSVYLYDISNSSLSRLLDLLTLQVPCEGDGPCCQPSWEPAMYDARKKKLAVTTRIFGGHETEKLYDAVDEIELNISRE